MAPACQPNSRALQLLQHRALRRVRHRDADGLVALQGKRPHGLRARGLGRARGGRAFWLDLFYYEAADAYRGDANPHGLPVARRRNGWSCVLADEEDLKTPTKVSVDGEDVLLRQGDEFVDALRLKVASDVAWRTNPAAVATHDYYLVADDEYDPCEATGYTEGAYERAAAMQRRASAPDEERDDMEGAGDENRFEDR